MNACAPSGSKNVFEVNFGLAHTAKANMRAYMWDGMKDWLLSGAIKTDEKMATDLAGPGYHINRSNLFGAGKQGGTCRSAAKRRPTTETRWRRPLRRRCRRRRRKSATKTMNSAGRAGTVGSTAPERG